MNKVLIALAGPTGSGKTAWSLRLAKDINGVVIAADSRTVYKSLDIGTGKVTTEYPVIWRQSDHGRIALIDGIDHYGLDLVQPSEQFTAADYQRYVYDLLPTIWEEGKTPILVGGTGLYIDAVTRGFTFPRATTLPAEWASRSTEDLAAELAKRDPATASQTDLNNRRRVERALAYHLATGQSFLAEQAKKPLDFQSQVYVIDLPRPELFKRIDTRIMRWLQMGLLDEVRGLFDAGLSSARIDAFGQVYRWTLRLVNQEISEAEFRVGLASELHTYARKQLTWWRRYKDVRWVSEYTELIDHVRTILSAHNT